MAINFPINPSNGDTYVVGEVTFTYNATKSIWSSEIITDPISLSLSLNDITNVSSTSPTVGQVLSYDVTNTEWVNTSPIDAYTKTEVDTAIGNVTVDLSAYDTSAQVDTKVAGIIDSAPATLNTLNELAAALGDDANHVTTMTTLVGTKADVATTYTKTEVDTAIGNVTVDLSGYDTSAQVDTKIESLILQAVSSGSVSAGDKLVLNSDGTVSSIEVSLNVDIPQSYTTSSTNTFYSIGVDRVKVSFSPDNPNNFIIFYPASGANYGYSDVWVVNHGTIIDATTPYIQWNGSKYTARSNDHACDISYAPNGKFVFVMSQQYDNYIGSGSVSSSGSISWSQSTLYNPGGIGNNDDFKISADPYDSNTVVLVYKGYSGSLDQIINIYKWDSSMSNLTLIHTESLHSEQASETSIDWDPFNSGRFIVGLYKNGGSSTVIKLCTINSDDTFTVNDTIIESVGGGTYGLNLIRFSPDIVDKFIYRFLDGVRVGNISNNTISVGTNTYYPGGVVHGLKYLKHNKIAAYYLYTGSNPYEVRVKVGTINNTNAIIYDDHIIIGSGISSNSSPSFDASTNGKFVATWYWGSSTGSKSSTGQFTTYTTTTNLTNNNFVGISSDTYTTGQSVNVGVVGHVADNQLNLITGNSYYVVGDGSLSTIPDEYNAFVGKSITSTSILILPKDTDLSAYDTSAQVDTKVAGIVDSAPATLDTLNELAAALGDDSNYATTTTTLIGTKANQSTTYTKTEVDTSLNLKSDKTTTYTKTEVDTSLNLKSDKTTTYTKTEVDSAVLSNWTEDANGHILPNTNDTHDIGSSTLKVRDIYMSGSTIHLGTQSISADADGIKMPAIKIGTGANVISLSASSDGKLVQTATVGGVVQTPTTSTGASVIVSDTPPSSPSSGDLWTDSTTMKMFIYYEDDDSSQWVGVSGSSGADGDIGPAGPVGPTGGLSVHLTPLALPTTGSTGDQAYVESNTSIYVYDENITGWYRVALINATPTYTSTPDAMYIFATDGTPIVVTPVAVDPEGSLVTYSVVGDMGTVATMTQDDNAFTFTPSTDAANAGEFNITFRVTDGTNVADAISNFTLSFGPDLGSWTTSGLTHHWDVSSFDVATDTTWIDKVSGVVLSNEGISPTVGGSEDNNKYFYSTSSGSTPYSNNPVWTSTEAGLYKPEQTLEIWASLDGAGGYLFSVDSAYPNNMSYGTARALSSSGGLGVVGYGSGPQDQWGISGLINNSWMQITLSYSSTNTFTIYVNGISKGTYTKTSSNGGGSRLIIGTVPWVSPNTWNGRYSNFKIYDRALSSTEVVYNFDGQKSRWGY